jgi:hypothetical protein
VEYNYIKCRQLNRKEKNRLRLAIQIDRRLRLSVAHEEPFKLEVVASKKRARSDSKMRSPIVEELLEVFLRPTPELNRTLVDWALCYAPPRLLSQLIVALAAFPPHAGPLGILAQANPSLLLPRDYIVPDFQRFQRSSQKPKTALLCFTGNALRLNLAVQLFHTLAVRHFDLIVYLRDDRKQRFVFGIPGLGKNLEELGATLQSITPSGCHTSVLSASSGSVAASRIAEAMGAKRMALFSPELTYEGASAIGGYANLNPDQARLYFARDNPTDRGLAAQWDGSHLSDSIRWLDTSSHATLSHMVYGGEFPSLAAWLSGASGGFGS